LPLFIVGLGQGWIPAAVGAAVGSGALATLWGAKAGLFFLIATAAGPVILSRLALIHRSATKAGLEGEASQGNMQWYPEGRLLLWAAALAGVLLTLVIILVGPDAETFQATLRDWSTKFAEPMFSGIPEGQRSGFTQLVDFIVALAPVASAAAWLVAIMGNLLLASRMLKAWGLSIRPWSPFSSLTFPRTAAVGLAASCAASFLPGTAGLIGSVFAAPLCTAFAILGLAVIHHLLLQHPARVPLLAGLYAALILLSWIVLLPLLVLGVADLGWNLRKRSSPLPPVNRNS
jgi:hypothetical protein